MHKISLAPFALVAVLAVPAETLAGDEETREEFRAAEAVFVQIRGRDRDVISITVKGKEVVRDRMYGKARGPGSMSRGDFVVKDLGNGNCNIAMRWGRDKDLMYAFAVRGDTCVAADAYHAHPSRSPVSMSWEKDDLCRFYRGNESVYLEYSGGRWKRN